MNVLKQRISEKKAKALEEKKAKNSRAALAAMRALKSLEGEEAKLYGHLTTLEQQKQAIESTDFDLSVVKNMQVGVATVKNLTEMHGINIGAIQELKEEIDEN